MTRCLIVVSVFVAVVLCQDAAVGQNLILPRVSQKATISQKTVPRLIMRSSLVVTFGPRPL